GIGVWPELLLDFGDFTGRKSLRPEQIAVFPSAIDPKDAFLIDFIDFFADYGLDFIAVPNIYVLARHIGHGNAEMDVSEVIRQDVAGQITLVHALHDDNHRAGLAI